MELGLVGKTAIVEGFAQRVIEGNIPELLAERRIVVLDLAMMVAGTKYRGQFEERIKAVMDEIKRTKNKVIMSLTRLKKTAGRSSRYDVMSHPLSRSRG